MCESVCVVQVDPFAKKGKWKKSGVWKMSGKQQKKTKLDARLDALVDKHMELYGEYLSTLGALQLEMRNVGKSRELGSNEQVQKQRS